MFDLAAVRQATSFRAEPTQGKVAEEEAIKASQYFCPGFNGHVPLTIFQIVKL